MASLMEDIRKIAGLPDGNYKIKLHDGGTVILQRDKVIFAVAGRKEHLTMWYNEDRTVNVHMTLEGKTRTHLPIDKLDTRLVSDEVVERLVRACTRRTSLDDEELRDLK